MTYSDEIELINNFNQKHRQAFNAIYNQYFGLLMYCALKITQDKDVSRDLAGDAFVKIWNNSKSYQNIEHLRGALYETTKNLSIDYIRKKKVQDNHWRNFIDQVEHDEDFFFLEKMEVELLNAIYQAAETLPPKCKLVFKKLYVSGLKHNEIAKELNISHKTVRAQQAKAFTIIKNHLPNEGLVVISILFFH